MVRGSGFLISMRIVSSRRTATWPDSVEASLTTAVYFTCSRSAVRLRNSPAALSSCFTTASVVQREAVCAPDARLMQATTAQSLMYARKNTDLKLGPCPLPEFFTLFFLSSMLTHAKPLPEQRFPGSVSTHARHRSSLALHLNFVADDGAVRVANGLDAEDGETLTTKIRYGALQGIVEIVREFRRTKRRRQKPRIHAVGPRGALCFDQGDATGRRRQPHLRFVVEPAPRSQQHKDQYGRHGDVVLPRAAVVGPEEDAFEDPTERAHVNPPTRRPQSRRRACAQCGQNTRLPPGYA